MFNFLVAMLIYSQPHYTDRALVAAPVVWEEAVAAGEDPYLIAAIAWVESRWNPKTKSKTNDCGFMQNNVKWSPYTCDELKELRTGIRAGIRSIQYWRKRFGKEWICHYNSGNKCFRRSRAYAGRVKRVMKKLRKLGARTPKKNAFKRKSTYPATK